MRERRQRRSQAAKGSSLLVRSRRREEVGKKKNQCPFPSEYKEYGVGKGTWGWPQLTLWSCRVEKDAAWCGPVCGEWGISGPLPVCRAHDEESLIVASQLGLGLCLPSSAGRVRTYSKGWGSHLHRLLLPLGQSQGLKPKIQAFPELTYE